MLRWHRPPKCPLSAPFLSPREAQWWSKRRDLAGCDRGAPRAPRFVKAVRRIALDKNPKQDQAPGASKMDFSGLFCSEWSEPSSRACGSVVDVRTCLFGVFADHDPAYAWLRPLALGVVESCCKLLLLLGRLLATLIAYETVQLGLAGTPPNLAARHNSPQCQDGVARRGRRRRCSEDVQVRVPGRRGHGDVVTNGCSPTRDTLSVLCLTLSLCSR